MSAPSMKTTPRTCARGCTLPRQHVTACEDREECRGCLPRPAEHGWLCLKCHLRLSASLAEVTGQHALLLSTTAPSAEMRVRPQPKHGRPDYHPTESTAPRYIYVTGVHPSSPQEGEPVRIACLDTARALTDLLTEWIEWVCEVHDATGPARLQTQAEREGLLKRRAVEPEVSEYEWVEPPARVDVGSAVRWLRGNIGRLEGMEAIGDMMEDLGTLMGQAHALTPWREQVKRIGGIPCPTCHRHTLRQYGGRDTVTCTTSWCEEEIPADRYLVWARMYEEESA